MSMSLNRHQGEIGSGGQADVWLPSSDLETSKGVHPTVLQGDPDQTIVARIV